VRNFVRRPYHALDGWTQQDIWLDVAGGDRLAASLHASARVRERPLVVLIHGLTGCADSHYVRASAHAWLTAGYPVCRLNLRGSLPSRPACGGHYHAGRSADIVDAVTGLMAHQPAIARTGLIPVGFSLGGNMLMKFLAETGGRYPVRAAVSVSAPIDLDATSRRFHAPRNAIYHRWLLQRLKMEATQPPAKLAAGERAAIAKARTVFAFDDTFVAPRHGFRDAHDYYDRCSGARFLHSVSVPLLAIHAHDDPWIPADAYHRFTWSHNQYLGAVVQAKGGHVGFHARDSVDPWHNRAMIAFVHDIGV
jgi:predicted alpha/beta-fold hydrolase